MEKEKIRKINEMLENISAEEAYEILEKENPNPEKFKVTFVEGHPRPDADGFCGVVEESYSTVCNGQLNAFRCPADGTHAFYGGSAHYPGWAVFYTKKK